jgi:hypothetical protein
LRQTVVVPAWNRPDFLAACLKRLLATKEEAHYILSLDRAHSKEVRDVAEGFAADSGREVTILTPRHRYMGNSYNVLNALSAAVEGSPDLVYLVEDDVLVGTDFFNFHQRSHELAPDVLAVSACRNQNLPYDPEPNTQSVYQHRSYQSLGVSFRPTILRMILAHVEDAYFSDPIGYCKSTFPDSEIPAQNAEQDGLIHRIGEGKGLPTIYPFVPRAYHAGFYGYHRKGRKLSGTAMDRAEQILAMGQDELNAHALTLQDHTVVDLDADREPVSQVWSFV